MVGHGMLRLALGCVTSLYTCINLSCLQAWIHLCAYTLGACAHVFLCFSVISCAQHPLIGRRLRGPDPAFE